MNKMQIVLARCLRKFTKALIIIKRTNSEADSYIKKKSLQHMSV